MNNQKILTPKLFCLIKFSKDKYNQEFINEGKIRFNPSGIYNEDVNEERGDIFEGSEWVYNGILKEVTVDHPILGKHEFKSLVNSKSQVIQYNSYFLSYSLYSVSANNFNNIDEFKIDNKLLEFGDSAVFINKPYLFLKKLVSELKKKGIKYELNYVDYLDFETDDEELKAGPYRKKKEHSHQMEFRIIIPNTDEKSIDIYLGDLSEYCKIYPSKIVCEMDWKGKIK